MAIPEEQLETWAKQGAITTAKTTHESVRSALAADRSPIRQMVNHGDVEIYLQGSYRNDTNIRGDSDVDLVVQLNTSFHHDLSQLSDVERTLFHSIYPQASYRWPDFKNDVLKALQLFYGERQVSDGTNCVNVLAGSGRLPADVLVCLEYRNYKYFSGKQQENSVKGVAFFSGKENRMVINYPKEHYENGVIKNNAVNTNGWFKPIVRIFKNARTYMAERGHISDELAPSYFVQCLLYNVPNPSFGTNYQTSYAKMVNWLGSADLASFVCQNGQLPMFGATKEQWSIQEAKEFITALISLWNTWGTYAHASVRH